MIYLVIFNIILFLSSVFFFAKSQLKSPEAQSQKGRGLGLDFDTKEIPLGTNKAARVEFTGNIVLGWIKRLVLPMAFDAARQAASTIKPDFLGAYIFERVQILEDVTAILIDKNKDNKTQITEYFQKVWKQEAADSLAFAKQLIDYFADDNFKAEFYKKI